MQGSHDTNKVQFDIKSCILLYINELFLSFSILYGKFDSKYFIQFISQCAFAFFVLFVKLWLPYKIFFVILWTNIQPTGTSLFSIAFSQYLKASKMKLFISSFVKDLFYIL